MSSKKIFIKLIIIIILILFIIFLKFYNFENSTDTIYNNKIEEESIEKENKKITKTKGLQFTQKELFYNDDLGGKLTVEILNSTNKTITIDGIDVNFKDNQGTIIKTIKGLIYVDLESNISFDYSFDINENIFNMPLEIEYIPNIVE